MVPIPLTTAARAVAIELGDMLADAGLLAPGTTLEFFPDGDAALLMFVPVFGGAVHAATGPGGGWCFAYTLPALDDASEAAGALPVPAGGTVALPIAWVPFDDPAQTAHELLRLLVYAAAVERLAEQ